MKQTTMTDSEIQAVLVRFWKWGNQYTPSGYTVRELYSVREWKAIREGWILGACGKDLTVKETITLLAYVADNF